MSSTVLWGAFKDLAVVVNNALHKRHPGAQQDLELALQKHKADFTSLLKNPVKNASNRKQVSAAASTPVMLPGRSMAISLPQDFADEAVLLSDLLDLNEFSSVDLLLAGEQQQPRYPGWSRGLVAVLLYHDGRRVFLQCLDALVQARHGRNWQVGVSEELSALATHFTDNLLKDGLVGKILELLKEVDEKKILARLDDHRGIGGDVHRRQLCAIIEEQRCLLSDILFSISCQTPLSKNDTVQLLNYLRGCDCSSTPSGTLDAVTLEVLMALLYAISVEHADVEGEAIIGSAVWMASNPIVKDKTFLPDVHRNILNLGDWKEDGLCDVVLLAWSVLLQTLSLVPAAVGVVENLTDPGEVFKQAVQNGDALLFLRTAVVNSPEFTESEFYMRRVHFLLTAVLTRMPHKVNELRSSSDEVARIQLAHQQEGLEPPAVLHFDFNDLMMLISAFYRREKLDLASEFWRLLESSSGSVEPGRSTQPLQMQPQHRHVMLQKFLRIAGDSVTSPMYVPYVEMLTALANTSTNSQCCFALLRTSGPAWRVSLEHIFSSIRQYFLSMKHDASAAGGNAENRPSSHRLNITEEELNGLVAVLKLTEQLVEMDESIRLAMYENQHWMPVGTFFGLLSCPVPPALKAQLLKTLSAFAKTPAVASTLWISMESAQVLQTLPATGATFGGMDGRASSGIEIELEEIEAREEVYPETRAFLEFLLVLAENSPIPETLGAGYRTRGIGPYLQFVRDNVFLNFDTRSYRRPVEKWEVCCASLAFLRRLLADHQPNASHFADAAAAAVPSRHHGADSSAPPGHTILLHMLNESPLLSKVLNVIFDCSVELGDVTGVSTVPAHLASVEQAGLLALQMLEDALSKQEMFSQLLRETSPGQSGSNLLVTPLDQLLLSVNSRTSQPDYFLHIAKFLSMPHCRPDLALIAVKILGWAVQSPSVHNKLVAILSSSDADARAILLGFVERLEADESEIYSSGVEQDPSTPSQVRSAIRKHILHMLLLALPCHSPNLAHFLLGYELLKPVSQTKLQDAGIGGSPRTCLHAILSLLECRSAAPTSSLAGLPLTCTASPRLAALCYRLLYELCAASATSLVTLRYLRSSHDFLRRQLLLTPPAELMQTADGQQLEEEQRQLQLDLMEQQTWLLRIAALELRLTSQQQQYSHTQCLVSLLFASSSSAEGMRDNRILRVLDCIDFQHYEVEPLQLQHFNTALVEEELSKRISRTDDRLGVGSVELYDVRAIHTLLMQELNSVQAASAAGRHQLILEEIEGVLVSIVERNMCRRRLVGRLAFFDAWRQVIEVVLIACPMEVLNASQRLALLFDLLQDLLLKVLSQDISQELVSAILPVVLTLMVQLRQSFAASRNTSLSSTASRDTLANAGVGLPAGPLHSVLVSVCEAISCCSSAQRRHRAYLYGALLYYLQLCSDAADYDSTADSSAPSAQERAFGLSQPSISTVLTSSNLETLASYGDAVMDIVCKDACEGHHVGRMLALSLLDAVIGVDWHHHWLQFLVRQGYLRHLIDSLVQEDETLQTALRPNPEPLRGLYIYESKMALLTRLAQTASGAQALLQLGLIGKLSECRFLDIRPDTSSSNGYHNQTDYDDNGMDDSQFIPTVLERYRQLILPTLKLVVSILTSVGRQNQDVANQVSHFVASHIRVFSAILEDQPHRLTLSALHELMLTTAVVSRVSFSPSPDLSAPAQVQRQHMQLKKMMLGLLPHYCQPQAWPKLVKAVSDNDVGLEQPNSTGLSSLVQGDPRDATGSGPTATSSAAKVPVNEQATIWLQQICANTLTYCRHYISPLSTIKRSPLENAIFEADISEKALREVRPQFSTDSQHATPAPPLAALVRQVRMSADTAHRMAEEQKMFETRLKNHHHLTVNECYELLSDTVDWAQLSTLRRQQVEQQWLTRLVQHRGQQVDILLYVIETSLFILWRHLEYFFLHVKIVPESGKDVMSAQPIAKKMRALNESWREQSASNFGQPDLTATSSNIDMAGVGITKSRSDQFKADAVVALSDAFLKKLVDLEVSLAKGVGGSKEFLQVFVRRTKRLLKLHQGPAATS